MNIFKHFKLYFPSSLILLKKKKQADNVEQNVRGRKQDTEERYKEKLLWLNSANTS